MADQTKKVIIEMKWPHDGCNLFRFKNNIVDASNVKDDNYVIVRYIDRKQYV